MEDELDVDIEGDEYGAGESAVILQDQYLQSAWRTDPALLPWTLDTSISDENREVIKNMLLEEQYYFAGKHAPKIMWTEETSKVKKSPVKNSGLSARWGQEEKDIFEKGLAQFGRRWTKIAKLIGTKSVLQVKSYARQYIKNKQKVKDEDEVEADVPSDEPQDPLLHCPSSSSSHPSVPPQNVVLANAVRIERLSDDEDVDITDDLSDDANQPENQFCSVEEPKVELPDGSADELPQENSNLFQMVNEPEPQTETWGSSPKMSLLVKDEAAEVDGTVEGTEDDQDDEDLKAPEQEVTLDRDTIMEEEKQAIQEFFEGRPSKTPERYLKIRNYILDQWENCKPKYLNKTSVRPGLKNCGDVNCIGRIHTYLELIGAINFNCEQAIYNRPRPVERSRVKESRDCLEAYQLAQRLQSMRTRKRRVRDAWGNWCDPRDLEGQTYEHLTAEELALRREEMRKRQPKSCKLLRKGSFDPFQLVPCRAFGEDKQEPFRVMVSPEALIVMDVHAHVSMGEVIGLLGGSYDDQDKVLRICVAEPCNSLSTGLQCEMDPVSQTQASELLGTKGHSVVGWYHSHPAFDPNPSLRDIDTQAKYQSYFSRGGAPFVGMIVSPYNQSNSSPVSQNRCLLVQEEEEGTAGSQKLPYKFNYHISSELPDWTEVMRRAEWVVFKYRQSYGCVSMDRLYRRDSSLTCLEKMLTSLRKILTGIPEVESFLLQIEALFITHFTDKRNTQELQEPGSSANFYEQRTQTFSQTLTFSNSNGALDLTETNPTEGQCGLEPSDSDQD